MRSENASIVCHIGRTCALYLIFYLKRIAPRTLVGVSRVYFASVVFFQLALAPFTDCAQRRADFAGEAGYSVWEAQRFFFMVTSPASGNL